MNSASVLPVISGAQPPRVEEKESSLMETTLSSLSEHNALLFDKVVYQGRNNMIYSPGGAGKSLLLMEITQSCHVKRKRTHYLH
jgi:RecA-family ATPase